MRHGSRDIVVMAESTRVASHVRELGGNSLRTLAATIRRDAQLLKARTRLRQC
jgi:hypothetical protein